MKRNDLLARLPALLPEAVAWVEGQERQASRLGRPLDPDEQSLARSVSVAAPERIRLVEVSAFPLPADPALRAAANATGLLGPGTRGLTLGHAVFLAPGGQADARLLRHEFRHVHQYEAAGSIKAFLTEYLTQIVNLGYRNAPLEIDARLHEA